MGSTARKELKWAGLVEGDSLYLYLSRGDDLAASIESNFINLGPGICDFRDGKLAFESRDPKKPVAKIKDVLPAPGYRKLWDEKESYLPFLVRFALEQEQSGIDLPPWVGRIAEDDDNWTDAPGEGAVAIADCSDRILRTVTGMGETSIRFVVPPNAQHQIFLAVLPAVIEAMGIAIVKLLLKLAIILSQSTCPRADCPLGWQSDTIVFHDYTGPPVIVQIPQGWPGAGGHIVTITPRIQAMVDIILSCG